MEKPGDMPIHGWRASIGGPRLEGKGNRIDIYKL